ncbi:MAG: hypothetical protein CGU28_09555 [Candidatus Dactylopiibacterium carminicum]|uniref:GGDEF domain-containing protein n=1 Tax=Candidatus Dactylopiibacterium carminicum TaxID=857335 RepID=A0A272ERT5_9RHOO|nr:GGDEF domain-containing protein [Candidatus Dactylopiibacterium carminicum]KAF7598881.1 hypothetical protein BGI27_10785 [Candidatus Dactylopiibacterium carminicum]PAS92821.1 MAG: hypothetical protein CGU29_10145 [Candidatus Dactylopiibacterium carminicum]PAS96273.1 MAG: hypothetical protein CGU28_09555 [Candidatus Dactylopiibacterium carminicum]PAS98899.1 MAG: hypothetical protein BSR46_10805 [Candidatus Dactylopiibacterium carminicum]
MAVPLPVRINLVSLAFTALVACVLTALGGYFLYFQQVEHAHSRARFAAGDLAERAGHMARLGLRPQDTAHFEEQCEAVIRNDPLLDEAGVLDPLGLVLHHYIRASASSLLLSDAFPMKEVFSFDGMERAEIRDPLNGGAVLGYTAVSINQDMVLRQTLRNVGWLVICALSLIAVGVLVQHVVFWKALGRPLAELVRTADEIQPDRLETIPPALERPRRDDIGRVYGALRRLIERLQEARFALLEQNAMLEVAVRLRTSELEHVNQALARDIERRKQLEEELRTQANTDALTGLTNRAFVVPYLEKRLAQAHRETHRLGLLLLDFDGFKCVNDTWGHAVGDRALQIMAQRMQQECRASDVLARLGGDEFLIVLEDFASQAEALGFCERIAAQFNEPVLVERLALSLGISIGLAIYPEHGSTLDTLLASADAAMYAIKQAGGGVALADQAFIMRREA